MLLYFYIKNILISSPDMQNVIIVCYILTKKKQTVSEIKSQIGRTLIQ